MNDTIKFTKSYFSNAKIFFDEHSAKKQSISILPKRNSLVLKNNKWLHPLCTLLKMVHNAS